MSTRFGQAGTLPATNGCFLSVSLGAVRDPRWAKHATPRSVGARHDNFLGVVIGGDIE